MTRTLLILLIILGISSCKKGSNSLYANDKNLPEYNRIINTFGTLPFKNDVDTYVNKGFTDDTPVFTGSSTFTRWNELESCFLQFKAINRGIGGSTIKEIINYSESLIFKNNPNILVLYIGDNDLLTIDFETFKYYIECFVENFKQRQPQSYILLVSIKPSPGRVSMYEHYKNANNLYASLADADEKIIYINIWDEILLKQADCFVKDGLHLNSNGYDIVEAKIKPVLKNLCK